jgi:hypothetical protein
MIPNNGDASMTGYMTVSSSSVTDLAGASPCWHLAGQGGLSQGRQLPAADQQPVSDHGPEASAAAGTAPDCAGAAAAATLQEAAVAGADQVFGFGALKVVNPEAEMFVHGGAGTALGVEMGQQARPLTGFSSHRSGGDGHAAAVAAVAAAATPLVADDDDGFAAWLAQLAPLGSLPAPAVNGAEPIERLPHSLHYSPVHRAAMLLTEGSAALARAAATAAPGAATVGALTARRTAIIMAAVKQLHLHNLQLAQLMGRTRDLIHQLLRQLQV